MTNIAVSSETSLTANFVLDPAAAEGLRTVTVTTSIGTSGPRISTITPPVLGAPTLASITPGEGIRGLTITVTLNGTIFLVGATTVAVGGTGVTVSNVALSSTTSLTASFALDPAASAGARSVTVTTGSRDQRRTALHDRFTATAGHADGDQRLTQSGRARHHGRGHADGNRLVVGATGVSVNGGGVTVINISVSGTTSLTANFVLDAAATAVPRTVTGTTAGGTSVPRGFTVNLAPPTLTSVSPNQALRALRWGVTLTGTNFVVGATVVNVSGADATATNVVVVSPTSPTASVVLDRAAAALVRTVTVTTAAGTMGRNLSQSICHRPVRSRSPTPAASNSLLCPPASSRSRLRPQARRAQRERGGGTRPRA